jgi:2-keto-4-pentenoate hydratase/2-oxohepta-3-ene-1,7-dioic acid hydratase in catechol pathway
LLDGDEVTVEIEGLGALTNPVHSDTRGPQT